MMRQGSHDPSLDIFGQANMALIRWVIEGSIFILIRVTRASACQRVSRVNWNHGKVKIRNGNEIKSESPMR